MCAKSQSGFEVNVHGVKIQKCSMLFKNVLFYLTYGLRYQLSAE